MHWHATIAGSLAMTLSFGASCSDEPATEDGTMKARALTGLSRLSGPGAGLVELGVARLVPELARRVASGPDWTAPARRAVLAKLAGEVRELVSDRYGPSPLFVRAAGLSEAGAELTRLAAEARFHAVDVGLGSAVTELAARDERGPPEIPDGWANQAWRTAAGEGEERLQAAAGILAERLGGEVVPLDTRIEVEATLLEALVTLVTRLPPAPRSEAVLADEEHGYYLSPDVLWRGRSKRPTREAVEAAFVATREGGLKEHIEGILPTHPQYRALVGAVRRYAAMCAEGPWPELPVPRSDREARSAELVTRLQTRLAREGLLDGTPSGVWDEATQEAVLAVQRARRLKSYEPRFDAKLVKELNVPCEERLRTLRLNVERWRHTAWRGEPESVQVNLAGQRLRYYRDGEVVMALRTIVGSDRSYFNPRLDRRLWKNASPILSDSIEQVVVNPEWVVPRRIIRDEIEPAIEEDPDYLEENHFRTIVGGDGATYYIQKPGPFNALGRIKILFPNPESVYLHDTPARNLFKLPVRALSHGCVRVDDAVELGAALLEADRSKDGESGAAEHVKRLVRWTTKTWAFRLNHPVPVFLEYYTASVDDSGVVWFHPDIYGYDEETLSPQLAHEP